MGEDEALRAAVAAAPTADLPRLVYADWLEEHDRPAEAGYLRTELALARLPADDPAAPPLREQLWRAWAAVEPAWLAEFTQPSRLRANPTPFPAMWQNFDLGEVREGNGTYDGWPYNSLPDLPLGELRGEFQYLDPPPPGEPDAARAADYQTRFADAMTATASAGALLPNDFVTLMGSPTLRRGHYSVTDCYFALPGKYAPVRRSPTDDGVHVHFYSDSQACVLWDVYAHSSGAYCVVARTDDYFNPRPSDSDDELAGEPDGPRAWFVAPSFEAFVYRVWIENKIWYSLHGDALRDIGLAGNRQVPTITVTTAMQAYIDHYRMPRG